MAKQQLQQESVAQFGIYNSTADQDQIRERPEVTRLTNGGYVLTWMTNAGTTYAQDGYYQVFDANGNAVTQATLASTVQLNSQLKLSATAMADGGFIVSWMYIAGTPQTMSWRRFNSLGVAQTADIQTQAMVNGNYTTGGNTIQLQDGSIVSVWSAMQSASNYDVYMSRYATDGTLLNSQVKVSTTTASNIVMGVALTNGNLVAVWRNDSAADGSGQGVYARIMTATGTPLTAEFRVNTTTANAQSLPFAVSLVNGGFVVAWQSSAQDTSGWGIYSQRYDNAGNKIGTEQRINTFVTGDQYQPEITALSDGGYFIVWTSNAQDGSGTGIYGQRFDASGNAIGLEIQISQSSIGAQETPSITQLADGDLLATWRSYPNGTYKLMQRRISAPDGYIANGSTGNDTLVGTSGDDVLNGLAGYDTFVGRSGNDILYGGDGLDTAQFSGDLSNYDVTILGNIVTVADKRMGTPDGTDTLHDIEILSFNDQTFNWVSHFHDPHDVQIIEGKTYAGKIFLESGDTIALVNPPAQGSVTLNADGTFSFTAPQGFYGTTNFSYRVTASSGVSRITSQKVEILVADMLNNGGNDSPVNNYTTDNQYAATTTKLPDGKTLIAWVSNAQDGSYGGVYAALYDASGSKILQDFRVNTTTTQQQFRPQATALADGGFVVVWESWAQGGPSYNVYYQRYDANGAAVGGETAVSTVFTTAEKVAFLAVTGLPTGGFVVAYTNTGQDGSYESVAVKQFDSAGAEIAASQANTFTTGAQYKPNIAVLQNGTYVVIWSSWAQGGSQYAVWGQRYSAAGAKLGSEFNIAQSNVPETETYTDIIGLTNGDFLVTWNEAATDGSGLGVFAKRFDFAGNIVKDKFQVNTFTAGYQWQPHVSALSDGGYLVVWEAMTQAGSTQNAIFAQRYNASNNKVGGEFQVKYDTLYNVGTEYTMNVSEQVNGNINIVWTSPDANGVGVYTKQLTIQASNFNGTLGDDIFVGNAGNQTMDGAAGTDTVVLSGAMADYEFTQTAGGLVAKDLRTGSPDGTDTFKNIEKLQFSDKDVNLTTSFPSIGVFALPVGGNFSYSLPADVTINVLTQPEHGTLSVSPDGHTLSYQGTQDDAKDMTFTYTMTNATTGFTTKNTGSIKLFNDIMKGYVPQSEQSFGVYDGTLVTSGLTQTVIRHLSNGKIVVAYRDSGAGNGKMRLDTFDGTTLTQIGSEIIVANTNVDQYFHDISETADGGFIVAWGGFNGAGNYQWSEAYLQRYDASGTAIGTWQQVNTDVNGAVMQVDTAKLTNGKIAVVYDQTNFSQWGLRPNESWNSNIKFKIYNADGTLSTAETTITPTDGSKNRYPAVTALLDGRFMVYYSRADQNGYSTALYGQIINPDGTKSGAEFLVNSNNAASSQSQNNLITLKDGTVVASWQASDGSGFGVYAQMINPNGTLKGSAILVNPFSAGQQSEPSLTALSDGGFFIVWNSQNTASPNDWDVWGRRFDASGNSVDMAFLGADNSNLGSTIRLNTVTAGHQISPSVTELSDGDLAIVWQNVPTSGASNVVLSRYNATIHGQQTLMGDAGDNIITGNAGDSSIYGYAGNDVLDGGAGADTLYGGAGNDTYHFGTGYGTDTIDNQDADGNDSVVFGTGIATKDLWFRQDGYSLEASLLGKTDKLVLQNWYVNEAQKVDSFKTSTGQTLDKSRIDQLVSAMAGFNPQAIGSVTSLSDLPSSVQNTIVASWQ